MKTMKNRLSLPVVLTLALLASGCRGPEPTITIPRDQLGFDIGDDYQLASYAQLSEYWRKLDDESERLSLVEYGRTSEGRPMLMGVITSPENHRRLARYQEISRRLALAEGLTDEEARALAQEGRSVVWIDAGLHASEVANAQALTEMVYQMVSRTDPETLRFLDDVILLAAFSNPDGLDLVANWYMREQEPTKRSTGNLPVLYQKYIGHDNNRESLLMNMPESESIGRVLYHEWFPQIMYNQHQTGPAGAVLFIGQMRDPNNPNIDPLIAPSTELVSAAIHSRYVAEGMPGAVSRSMASYQNWWNGGVRSTAVFHNQIAIISEISGNPTPIDIAFLPRNLVARNDNPLPVQPQEWHFRQTIDYLVTAERAVLDVASKHREDFLFNAYVMGRNSIERGSRDTWTMTANKVAAVESRLAADGVRPVGRSGYPRKYYDALRDPALRDPRGYVLPSDQPDFLTATKFVNALIKNGVTVHRATQAFQVADNSYPAGSYVVKTAQAFRPHVLDNFEPQDYPNDFLYPGGPPIRPYDVTGYTLAYQMGVHFDRIFEGFDGPLERVEGFVETPAGEITGAGTAGHLLSHQVNDAFVAVNRLLAAGRDVYWLENAFEAGGKSYPAGTIYIPATASGVPELQALADEIGLNFDGVDVSPAGTALRLRPLRIGVVDRYGGSMPSGWVQWIFEQYGFPYEVIYPPTLDAGNLSAAFDVLIFEDGIVSDGQDGQGSASEIDPGSIPAEYGSRLGNVTEVRTIPQLRSFLADGGSIIAIGSSTSLAASLGAPVMSALVDAGGKALPPEKFYIPGTILQARVDVSHPLAYGMPATLDVFFDNNPLFRLRQGTGARPVAWFDSGAPLRSGWAWGQEHLAGAVAVADADVGKGKLVLLGPLVVFRAHPHATFKFLFNGVYYGSAERVAL